MGASPLPSTRDWSTRSWSSGRAGIDELKKQVKAEAKEVKKAADEVKKAADEKLSVHEVERERRIERIRAEAERHDELKQMKKDVEAEARELKKLLEDG